METAVGDIVTVEVLHLDCPFNQYRVADVGRVAWLHRSPAAVHRFRWLRRLNDVITGCRRYVDPPDSGRRPTRRAAAVTVAAVDTVPSCVRPLTIVTRLSSDVICWHRISHTGGFHNASRRWRHAIRGAIAIATGGPYVVTRHGDTHMLHRETHRRY